MRTRLRGVLTLLVAFLVHFTYAQEKTVSGTVSDEYGLPLPGVNIVIEGTTSGTQTDFDGNYSISVSEGKVLLFTYIGQKDARRTVGAGNTLSVQMEPDTQTLEEVVVLGYSARGKNEVTGSTVQVNADQINDVPVASVDQALQGKVPGLTIATGSGTPGAIQDIRIRGLGSFSASNSPLIVIDGVPVINSNFSGSDNVSSLSALASINNKDVESISVLKDASATSAYGARGSNGVIVITTKKGKSGSVKFAASSSYGVQDFAVDGPRPLTAAEREQLAYDAIYNSYGESFGFDRDGAQAFYEANPGAFGTSYTTWNEAGRPEGDWGKAVKNKNAPIKTFDISASGGGEGYNFFASLGYNKTEAIVIGSDFERITGRFNFTKELTDKFKLELATSVSNTNQGAFLERGAFFANPFLTRYFMPPTEQPYNEDGTLNTNLNTSVFNTVYLAENDIYNNDLTRALVNTSLSWKITDKITFKTRYAIDYNLAAYKAYQNRVHGGSVTEGGSVEQTTGRNFNWVTQNSLNYRNTFGGHTIDVTALQEYQKNKYNFLGGYGENFPTDGLTNLDNTSANFAVEGSFEDWSNAAYLGLFNYSYQGKYIFDATFRREGSSRFAPGNRWGNFWSVGGAWNISSEDFMNQDVFNLLRLRASYGVSGNSGIGLNEYQALLGFDADYNNQGAVYPTGYGNPNLTWEKNRNYDIGFDFGLFNNRLSGSVAYFNKNTYDLLQDVPLSFTTGFAEVAANVGEMENKGFEADLNYQIIQKEDLNWSVFGNVATLDNEVLELAKDGNGEDITFQTGTRRTEVGRPYYEWYMRKWAGVDPDNGDPLWYINGEDGETTNDYNQAERAFQGTNAIPSVSGGFGTDFNYKGFFINANFYFAKGHKIYEDWARYTKSGGTFSTFVFSGTSELTQSWRQPGDITDYPKLTHGSGDGQRGSFTSTRFLYEGDYLRLRELSFGYDFKNQVLDDMGIDNIRFSIRGTNIFTWVKDDRLKYDPEVRADGFTRLTTPPVKSWLFGMNINF